jgi:hypothetical protein
LGGGRGEGQDEEKIGHAATQAARKLINDQSQTESEGAGSVQRIRDNERTGVASENIQSEGKSAETGSAPCAAQNRLR